MQLNQIGQVVAACWLEIPQHFPTVSLDEWVVMPNHLHGILALEGIKVGHTPSLPDGSLISVSVGTRHASPLPLRYASSLSTIIGSFKAAVAKRVNALRGTPGTALWQRNYYEHVVRNEKSLIRIRQYIANNPAQWPEDPYNPLADGLNAEGPTVGTAR